MNNDESDEGDEGDEVRRDAKEYRVGEREDCEKTGKSCEKHRESSKFQEVG